jgi:hypothetical protein
LPAAGGAFIFSAPRPPPVYSIRGSLYKTNSQGGGRATDLIIALAIPPPPPPHHHRPGGCSARKVADWERVCEEARGDLVQLGRIQARATELRAMVMRRGGAALSPAVPWRRA